MMIKKYALYKVFAGLRESTEEVSVRSLARLAKVSVATSKRCLDYLHENKQVEKKIIGNTHQYKLRTENVLNKQIKIAMSISELQELTQELEHNKTIISATLYGSTSTGKDHASSDIDIVLITQGKKQTHTFNSEKKLTRTLSPTYFTYNEWKEQAEENKAFYEQVILDGIQLKGELPVVN